MKVIFFSKYNNCAALAKMSEQMFVYLLGLQWLV